MQNKKTGELISFCLESVAILAGKETERKFLNKIGLDIGLLFQITDDLLDVFGDSKKVGKPTRGDKKKGKATIIKNLGVNKAIEFSLSPSKNVKKSNLSFFSGLRKSSIIFLYV